MLKTEGLLYTDFTLRAQFHGLLWKCAGWKVMQTNNNNVLFFFWRWKQTGAQMFFPKTIKTAIFSGLQT